MDKIIFEYALREFLLCKNQVYIGHLGALKVLQHPSQLGSNYCDPPSYGLSYETEPEEHELRNGIDRFASYLSMFTHADCAKNRKMIEEYALHMEESIKEKKEFTIHHVATIRSVSSYMYAEASPHLFPSLPSINISDKSSSIFSSLPQHSAIVGSPEAIDTEPRTWAIPTEPLPAKNQEIKKNPPRRRIKPASRTQEKNTYGSLIDMENYPTIVRFLLAFIFILLIVILGFYLLEYWKRFNLFGSIY